MKQNLINCCTNIVAIYSSSIRILHAFVHVTMIHFAKCYQTAALLGMPAGQSYNELCTRNCVLVQSENHFGKVSMFVCFSFNILK